VGGPFPWAPYLVGAAGLAALHERLRADTDVESALLASLVTFAATSLSWSMTHLDGLVESVMFAVVAAGLFARGRLGTSPATSRALWAGVAVVPIALHFWLLPRQSVEASWDQALFSSTDGLLALTPVVYVALAGTVARARRHRGATVTTLVILAAWIAVATVAPVTGAGGRFGHGLSAAPALLAPGLADVIERMRRRPWPAVGLLATALVAWNYWLMIQYTVGLIPKDAPVSFIALVRQQADVTTRTPYVYPFAFPANVWFAWREGLPPARYEQLAFEPVRETFDLALSGDATRFLLDGWESAAADAVEPPRWTRDRRATLAVPIAVPPDTTVEIAMTARARLDDPPVNATLGVEVNGRLVGVVTVPPAAVTELRIPIPRDVGTVFRAGYNQLALVSHGVARVDASDGRPAGPMARRLGDRPWPVAVHRIRIGPREP
jgi:hypothetical protein